MKVLPATVAKWFPGPLHCLGTDGFGRSDGRAELRDFFEVDARYIALAALRELAEAGDIKAAVVKKAIKDLDIDPDLITTQSDIFRIEATAQLNDLKMTVDTVVRRLKASKTGKWICKTLSWQAK